MSPVQVSEVETNKDARLWGMLAHLLALSALVTAFGGIVGPLVAWLVKKNEHPFVDDQGKESLNFQITCFIAGLVAFLLTFVVIGLLLIPVVLVFWLVFTIIGAVKANEGVRYRYPVTIRFIQ